MTDTQTTGTVPSVVISSKCITEPQEPQPHLWDGTPMAAMQYIISKETPMTDTMPPLLPCPFCGGEPSTIERPDNIDGTEFFFAAACHCGGYSACAHKMATRKTPELAKTDAIEAWNLRASKAPIEYTPGKWFDATTVDLMQAFFESRLPAIREAAKEHGYAIGLHGSMRRDLDLIAAPWREGASDPDTLAHAIAMAACGITRNGAYEWEQKPAGRVATCLPICWTHRHGVLSDGHIDLSVMPAKVAQQNPAAALAIEALEVAKNGLDWYRDEYPDQVNGCDDEADELIERAITALSATAGDPT